MKNVCNYIKERLSLSVLTGIITDFEVQQPLEIDSLLLLVMFSEFSIKENAATSIVNKIVPVKNVTKL
jgi:hypothetical protein